MMTVANDGAAFRAFSADAEAPLVSVYVSTRDRVVMARRAIDSVLAQTYPAIELIVSDDGSQEAGYDELAHHVEAHGGTYVKAERSGGACVARNRAIEAASGLLTTGLDDDDEFTPDRVAELVQQFDPALAFVASGYLERGRAGDLPRTFDHGAIELEPMLHYNRVGNQVLTLTERLRALDGFDSRLPAMQDYDMFLRLVQAYGPGLKIPSCTYVLHTEHEGERISSDAERFDRALAVFHEKHQSVLEQRHLDSHALLSRRAKAGRLGLGEMFSRMNRHNYRLALSYYRDQPRRRTAGGA